MWLKVSFPLTFCSVTSSFVWRHWGLKHPKGGGGEGEEERWGGDAGQRLGAFFKRVSLVKELKGSCITTHSLGKGREEGLGGDGK